MKVIKLVAAAIFLCLGTAYAQDMEKKMHMKVVVDNGDGPNVVSWAADGEDFNDMAVGETRTLGTDSGEDITVTKTETGLEFNVNGETVVVPEMGDHGTHMAFVNADGVHTLDGDIDVEVIGVDGHESVDVRVIGGGAHALPVHEAMDGVTIISPTPLDDSVKESIRSVLISAGNDDEVRFIDGSGDGEHVKVIRKQVEIQQ
jgi:hypothetical protein